MKHSQKQISTETGVLWACRPVETIYKEKECLEPEVTGNYMPNEWSLVDRTASRGSAFSIVARQISMVLRLHLCTGLYIYICMYMNKYKICIICIPVYFCMSCAFRKNAFTNSQRHLEDRMLSQKVEIIPLIVYVFPLAHLKTTNYY